MRAIQNLSIIALACSTLLASVPMALAGADTDDLSLVAPEVEDIDDPFRRGLDRAAAQSTDGIAFPERRQQTAQQGHQGESLLGLADDKALLTSRYRVVGVAVSRQEADAQIFPATNQDVMPGDRPMLAYARIGSFENSEEARQVAVNLKSVVGELLGANFVMRDEDPNIILDVGPARSVVHAERYCELLLSKSNGIVTDCFATLEYPGEEPVETFTSTAMLRASARAVRDIIKNDDLFDLEEAATRLMTLREGDMLGAGSVNVAKITPKGIIVVAENGDVDVLPLDYVPERAFTATKTDTSENADLLEIDEI